MSNPMFQQGEEVRVGPYAYDRRMIGKVCRVERILAPILGEHRYAVSAPGGMSTIVLESTLQVPKRAA